MRQIQINIDGKGKTFKGPSMWSEVPEEMVLRLLKLIREAGKENFLFLVIPQLLYNIPYQIMQIFTDAAKGKRYKSENDDDPETLLIMGSQILDSCSWVFSQCAPTKWLLPKLSHGKRIFYSPKDKLADLTFKEFFFTEQYAGTDPAMLCAILYRSKKWPSLMGLKKNPRKELDLDQARIDSNIFRSDTHADFRSYVEWNYSGMIQNLISTFPYAFEKPNPEALATAGPASSTPWLDAALAMSEGNPVTFEKFEETNLFLALKMLNTRIKQNKDLEALHKKK